MINNHQAVMLDESINGLNIKNNGIYIDATFGRGGHSSNILKKLNNKGRIISIDKDIQAINYAKKHLNDHRFEIKHDTFANMLNIIDQYKLVGKINGILMDLGVSSPQLKDSQRGFSFNQNGPLDMRMDQTQGMCAATWLKNAKETEIADVLYKYAQERKSYKIARAIKKYQQNKTITTTLQLADIISSITYATKNKHPATRSFQAIRIFINQELKQLSLALEQTIKLLTKGGRLVVVSFHSLEDTIVKKFIVKHSSKPIIIKNMPIIEMKIDKTIFKNLGKKKPSAQELKTNKHARSAILRVAEKC